MNYYASEDYNRMDSTLNDMLNQVYKKRSNDTLLVNNLKRAQNLWEMWREQEIKAFYPDYPDVYFYGSMQPLCVYSKLVDWTEERIKMISVYLNGVGTDDACGPGQG